MADVTDRTDMTERLTPTDTARRAVPIEATMSLATRAALEAELAVLRTIAGVKVDPKGQLADDVPARIIKTEEGRLFARLHCRALELALYGEARTPLPQANHP